ncbi:hypothetical protein [Roseiconus lacunae]|uniref:hypothetical protein n=1 Tax=Roseiconus lacunae TaxID=2605694 RepID=UPI0011F26C61|nr:hypothetical protein [Roseiconus lacunae]WRQ49321.1 hypothetical protein U8335_20470 [Stieleria sp. HD01]
MSKQILEELGRRLMLEVRDETLSDWEMILDGRMKGERAERIRELTKDKDGGALASAIPEVVDSVLHHLLRWLEEEEQFRLVAQIGAELSEGIAQESDGLSGELHTSEGWIARYSEYK